MNAFRPGNRIHKKQDLTFSTGSFKILTCFLRGSISLQLTPCLAGLNLVALLNMASKLTSDLLSEMVQIVITPRNKYAKQMFSHKLLFFKNGPTPASFSFIFVFPNKHYKFYNKYVCDKMSIQYMVPGFELTTFGT